MRFKGMKALLAEFPNAPHVCQVRVIARNGSYVDVEGPLKDGEATSLLTTAMGTKDGEGGDVAYAETNEKVEVKG